MVADKAPAVAEQVPAGVTGLDEKAFKTRYQTQKAYFEAQPRVQVRLPNDEFVQINGFGFQIKGKENVSLPQDVVDLLIEAGRL